MKNESLSTLDNTCSFIFLYLFFLYYCILGKAESCRLFGRLDSPETRFAISASEKFNSRWNVMFERLQRYEEERGDCLFPQKYEEDPQLDKSSSHQRSISTVDDKMKARTWRQAELDLICMECSRPI
jgi:hypothetical protein